MQSTISQSKANLLFKLSVSPLAIIGLPRFLYSNSLGNFGDVFKIYFVLFIVGKIGLIHMLDQISSPSLGLANSTLNVLIGLAIFGHICIAMNEIAFFNALRKNVLGNVMPMSPEILERGPVVGYFAGTPIPGYLVLESGRYDYDQTAECIGDLEVINEQTIAIAPGLMYKKR